MQYAYAPYLKNRTRVGQMQTPLLIYIGSTSTTNSLWMDAQTWPMFLVATKSWHAACKCGGKLRSPTSSWNAIQFGKQSVFSGFLA